KRVFVLPSHGPRGSAAVLTCLHTLRRPTMRRRIIAPKRSQRHLNVEWLEPRTLLAGNILASVDATGNLTLTGDSQINDVTITQVGLASFVITGNNATTVNGL